MNVGLDLHKRYSQHAVMDVFGTVLRQGRIDNTLEEMKEFSESLPAGSSIAIESSSTWYWAYRVLSERHNVVLSNPFKNRLLLLFDNYRGLELLTLPCDMDTLEPKDRNPIPPNPGSLRK